MMRKLFSVGRPVLAFILAVGCSHAFACKGLGLRSRQFILSSVFNSPDIETVAPSTNALRNSTRPNTTRSAPTAVNDFYTTAEDATLTVNASAGVLANDYTVDTGDVLNAVLEFSPTHGTLTLDADGSFTYVPKSGYYGTSTTGDSFQYVVHDVTNNTYGNFATVTLAIPPTPPTGTNHTYSVVEDGELTVSAANGLLVGAAPGIPSDGVDVIEEQGNTGHGTININTDGSFTYVPSIGLLGQVQISFRILDEVNNTYSNWLTIFVNITPKPPITANVQYNADQNTTLNVPAGVGVLADDVASAYGDTVNAINPSTPAHGSLTLNPDGSFSYTPNAGYLGVDSFTYQAQDLTSNTTSSPATVTIQTVAAKSTAPIAVNDSYEVRENLTLTVGPATGVLSDDSSGVSGDVLVAVEDTPPTNGTVNLSANGSFTYTPSNGFLGTDSFTYHAQDIANGQSSVPATVSISVNSTDPPSTIVNSTADTDDGACTVSLCTLRDALTYVPAGATVTFAPNVQGVIHLGEAQLTLSHNLTVTGPGSNILAVAGPGAVSPERVLEVASGTVAISGLTITNGFVNQGGGGVIILSGSTSFSNCAITQNEGGALGGGVCVNGGAVTLTNCQISDNSLMDAGIGGGVASINGPITLNGCSISNNTQSAIAGSSGISINNCTISGNSGGPGIALSGGTSSITNSTISNNLTGDGQNTASMPGGGALWNSGTVVLTNDTIAGNTSIIGGGIYNSGTISLVNCTVTGNSTGRIGSTKGGGIYNDPNAGTASLLNSIVSGNSAALDPDVLGNFNNAGGTVGYNVLGVVGNAQGFSPGNHDLYNVPASTIFGNNGLADNGGPTQTVALTASSPAIDAGFDTTQAPYGLAIDQRGAGFPRKVGYTVDIGSFEFQTALPRIASFSPKFGAAGTTVTISGHNFNSATSTLVSFNGTAATSVTLINEGQITAVVPAGATSGPVTVATSSGSGASAVSFTVLVTPIVSSLSPTSGSIGSSVKISGANFTNINTTKPVVRFGSGIAVVMSVTANSMVVAVPSGATTSKVTVTTSGGTGASSASYTVVGKPSITTLSPTSGSIGSSVVLTGTNFTNATTSKPVVRFGSAVGVVMEAGAKSATVTVPTGAATGKISVTTSGGTAESATNFTVVPRPSVTSLSPTSGSVGSSVMLKGTNFTNATTTRPLVKFGTAIAVATQISATSATVTIPFGAVTGDINLTTTGGTAKSASKFTVVAKPTITSFSPPSGMAGTKVTIKGTNLTNATTSRPSVMFQTEVAVVTSVSATAITVTVPTKASSGKISVTTTGGAASSNTNFVVESAELGATPASNIELSSAGARAATSAITLAFTGALDINSALDASHYSVTVNGAAITVESVRCVHGTVTLGLGGGTLAAGDSVKVRWNGLNDAEGGVLNGQIGSVMTR